MSVDMCINAHIRGSGPRSINNMQNTRISPHKLHQLHAAVLDIVAAINRPQRDGLLIEEAGIALNRALFPLLVGIGRFGPIGVVEMADRVGRDYTTVSRQFAKLESLGLVKRQGSANDGRVREAVITPKGKVMTNLVDAARERLLRAKFSRWNARDFDDLVRLTRKLADAFNDNAKI
jgi:DNA-binding MarR family transcriptional regulator